ncbi:hypothetical protein [Methylobacterium mesophilicum]
MRPESELGQRAVEGPPRQRWPAGLSHAEIAERLPDVASNTLNAYLSMMVMGGEAVRNGDFFTAPPVSGEEPDVEADPSNEPSVDGDAHRNIEADQ